MPLQQTSGNVTADAYGGGVAVVPNYIEDVFSTWLYTGNGSTQTITNGIDLSTKGGLVWIKDRTQGGTSNVWFDTVRGVKKSIQSNSSSAQTTNIGGVTAFNTNGFSLAYNAADFSYDTNYNGDNLVGWTFAQQNKFHKIVTWTGNDATPRTITHNLGSVPGCIIVKKTSGAEDWFVFHRSMGNNGTFQYFCILNSTAAQDTGGYGMEKASSWTSTTFSLVSGGGSALNEAGQTYVAYVFAHNAGGFGLTGTDNVISCGSFTTNGSGGVTGDINLGYEAQWVMMKCASTTSNWIMVDVMRGFSQTAFEELDANTSAAAVPVSGGAYLYPTATGFGVGNGTLNNSQTWVYIAIRRGPMKVPTDGTKVFAPTATSAATGTAITTNFPVDFQLYKYRAGIDYWFDVDRLRGVNTTTTANSTPWLDTTSTTAEATATNVSRNWGNTGVEVPGIVGGAPNIFYSFGRAPGFFDEVCYTGTGANAVQTHNLQAVPELIIIKSRTGATRNWYVYGLFSSTDYRYSYLNDTFQFFGPTLWGNGTLNAIPTASTFSLTSAAGVNGSGENYVAYLFASCPGVSKVGSYTGNGTTQTINCGFAGGARFVLIKRTDSTGDWYVYDTARGMTVLVDPYLLLNSTAAESATLGSVITTSVGFIVDATILAAVNTNGASYIYLAIA